MIAGNNRRSLWWMASLLLVLAGCGSVESEDETGSEPARKATNVAGVEEVPAEPVDDPCDCFSKEISRGKQRFCRESKRDVKFLEALRKCGTAEVTGVSALDKIPGDGYYTMNLEQSIIQWQGSKAGMFETGTVPFRTCEFEIRESALVAGSAVVEMNAIKVTSIQGSAARSLAQHLRGEDFFNVAEFPTAAFSFDSGRADGRGNLVMEGKMNIKGISNPVTATLSFGSSDPVVASVGLVFNRADFDVRYGSGSFFDNLGDDLISDEVNLKMVLVEDPSKRKSVR